VNVRAATAFKLEFDRRVAAPPRAMRRNAPTARATRRKTVSVARYVMLGAIPLIMLCGYVGLNAELVAQTYRLNADQQQQAQLVQSDDALRQRLAQAQSVGRLEAAASALHMKEPASIAVITLPAASTKPTTTAFAAGLASFKRLFVAR
jgi:folylpolyglutamate synthase/dihydropteroate synthase